MRNRKNTLHTMLAAFLFLLVFCGAAAAIDLTVILPGGQTLQVSAAPEETVNQVKQKIYAMSDIDPLNQIVYRKDTRLDEEKSLSSQGVANGDTLRIEHGVLSAPTAEEGSGIWWVLLTILIIIGIGVIFMRKKPSREYDGR